MGLYALLTSTPTGFEAIQAQMDNIVTVVGDVFEVITGNAYLAFFAAAGLIAVGVHIFGLVKGISRS